MKLVDFETINTRGIKRIVHNDDFRSLDLRAILTDINRHMLDVLGILETHFGELEYLQSYSFFTNSKNNRFHGTCIIVKLS